MKQPHLVGTVCLLFLAAIIAAAIVEAEDPGMGADYGFGVPSSADGRAYNENPGMGYFKGKTWQDLMDEYQNTPMLESVFTTVTKTGTSDLTPLDNEASSRAIALEQVKGLLVDGLIEQITADAKTASGHVSKKVYGKSAGISYELLPDKSEMSLILPSLILVEKTAESLKGGVLTLEAKTRVALSRIVPMISAIHAQESVRSEIRDVRSMATDAMGEISRLRETAAASGKRGDLNQPYSDAVNRLTAADQLERGRYFALEGETQRAIDAYTKALESSPGLAMAYRHRGSVYLYLKENGKAMADFLNAYTSDAIDHTESRNFPACLDATEAALKLFEDYGPAYYQRAVCNIGLDRQKTVKADLIRAAQLGEKRAQGFLTSKGIAW